MNQVATTPPSEPVQAEQQPVVKKQPETYWHVVVFYGDKFADYQIAMTYPFFHIGDVRAAIEREVGKPVIIMNWSKLGVEEYVSSRQLGKPPEPVKAAPAPTPLQAVKPAEVVAKTAKPKLHKAKKK